jgi:hypothetical protein
MRLSLLAFLGLAAFVGIMAFDTPNADARTVINSPRGTTVVTGRTGRVAVVRRPFRRFAVVKGVPRGARGAVIVRRPGVIVRRPGISVRRW